MKKNEAVEKIAKSKNYQRCFLGLPEAKWTTSDLYIRFVNPIKPL